MLRHHAYLHLVSKSLHQASSLQCFRDVLVDYHRWAKRVEVKARQEKLWYSIKCFMNQQHQIFMVFHPISCHFNPFHSISYYFTTFHSIFAPDKFCHVTLFPVLGGRCLQAWSDRGVPIQLGWGKDAAGGMGMGCDRQADDFQKLRFLHLGFLDGKKYGSEKTWWVHDLSMKIGIDCHNIIYHIPIYYMPGSFSNYKSVCFWKNANSQITLQVE